MIFIVIFRKLGKIFGWVSNNFELVPIIIVDEPDYCVEITEVDRQSTEPFLAARERSGFELVVKDLPVGIKAPSMLIPMPFIFKSLTEEHDNG